MPCFSNKHSRIFKVLKIDNYILYIKFEPLALQAQQKEQSAADNSDDSISVSSIDQKSNPEVSEIKKIGTKRHSTSAEISDPEISNSSKKVARLEPEVANGIEQDEPLDLSQKARAESERTGYLFS